MGDVYSTKGVPIEKYPVKDASNASGSNSGHGKKPVYATGDKPFHSGQGPGRGHSK